MVGLYPGNAVNYATDVSAYYLFTTENGRDWDPLELSDALGNFSLIIEWTLSIANKTTTTITSTTTNTTAQTTAGSGE